MSARGKITWKRIEPGRQYGEARCNGKTFATFEVETESGVWAGRAYLKNWLFNFFDGRTLREAKLEAAKLLNKMHES